jgi:hypothetical protein
MMNRLRSPKLAALAAAALTALGVGGAAMAQSSGQTSKAPAQQRAVDKPDAPEKGESATEKPGDDGPGGHADEGDGDGENPAK